MLTDQATDVFNKIYRDKKESFKNTKLINAAFTERIIKQKPLDIEIKPKVRFGLHMLLTIKEKIEQQLEAEKIKQSEYIIKLVV